MAWPDGLFVVDYLTTLDTVRRTLHIDWYEWQLLYYYHRTCNHAVNDVPCGLPHVPYALWGPHPVQKKRRMGWHRWNLIKLYFIKWLLRSRGALTIYILNFLEEAYIYIFHFSNTCLLRRRKSTFPRGRQNPDYLPLQWRHNGRSSVLNHWRIDCFLTRIPGVDQRKRQSSASLAFVKGIHRWPVNSPHKGPVTRKMFPFHDAIIQFMTVACPRH